MLDYTGAIRPDADVLLELQLFFQLGIFFSTPQCVVEAAVAKLQAHFQIFIGGCMNCVALLCNTLCTE
jgi:hypothetical protein